jgi:hypothetical protein
MAEEEKKTQEGFQGFCGAMLCGEMMRKMLENKKSGQPCNCAGMLSKMKQMFSQAGEKKEETKENHS